MAIHLWNLPETANSVFFFTFIESSSAKKIRKYSGELSDCDGNDIFCWRWVGGDPLVYFHRWGGSLGIFFLSGEVGTPLVYFYIFLYHGGLEILSRLTINVLPIANDWLPTTHLVLHKGWCLDRNRKQRLCMQGHLLASLCTSDYCRSMFPDAPCLTSRRLRGSTQWINLTLRL